MDNIPTNTQQPQVKPVQPTAPIAAQQPAAKPITTAPLPKDQTKTNKRFVAGCLSAFGCSVIVFIGVLFFFLIYGSIDSPIFRFLGNQPSDVVNSLIALTSIIFIVLIFISFIFVVIGFFKITTARKDDKPAKRAGIIYTLISSAAMIFLIFIWIIAYFLLAEKRTVQLAIAIATTPDKTINLTAPIDIKFDATKAPIKTAQFDILSYEWDFGDGEKVRGAVQTHTFKQVGNFTAKLTITIKEKATAKESTQVYTKDVTISNVIANVVIKADKTKGSIPLTVNLDGSGSDSVNGQLTSFNWDLNGDGTFDEGTDKKASVTLDKIGTYKVQLRVVDSTGTPAIASIELEALPSDEPVAVIEIEDFSGTELVAGTAYMFNAGSSTAPAGNIEKYSWSFGDGEKADTRTATHIYKDAGEYDVTVTVTDTNKKTGTATKRFTVKAKPDAPIVSVKTTPEAKDGIITGTAPLDVIFDGSASQDPNNNIVQYSWDFNGDGKADDANKKTSHKFTEAGVYNVTLTVTDATDLSTKDQVIVKVESAGVKADISADQVAGVVPLRVNFDASGSSYAEGKIVNYEWDFGDKTDIRPDSAKVSYQYTTVGTFTAKVTAITQDNKRATAQITINVRPVSLEACFEPSIESGKAPLAVQFNPSCSRGGVVKYRWNFAGLGQSTDRKPLFTFKDPGEYDVTLEVTDVQNVINSFTKKITVTQ